MDLLPFQGKRKITFRSGITSIAKDIVPEEKYFRYKKFFSEQVDPTSDILTLRRSILSAVFLELFKYYYKEYSDIGLISLEKAEKHLEELSTTDLPQNSYKTLIVDTEKKTLYTSKFKDDFTQEDILIDLARVLGILCSPPLFQAQTAKELPLYMLDSLLILLTRMSCIIRDKTQSTKESSLEPISLLPSAYKKMIEKLLKSEATLQLLGQFLNSKKKTKKYMRILQKRFGVYHKKKPPFKKVNNEK